jgi:hypothetical protein
VPPRHPALRKGCGGGNEIMAAAWRGRRRRRKEGRSRSRRYFRRR